MRCVNSVLCVKSLFLGFENQEIFYGVQSSLEKYQFLVHALRYIKLFIIPTVNHITVFRLDSNLA